MRRPDTLSFCVAFHIREATPWLHPNPFARHALEFMRWRVARLRALAAKCGALTWAWL